MKIENIEIYLSYIENKNSISEFTIHLYHVFQNL